MLTSRSFIAAATALGALSAGLIAAAPAQAQVQERVFVDLGNWTILERPAERMCVLTLRNREGAQIAYSFGAVGPARLTIQTPARSNVMVGDVVWAFDEVEIPGRAIGTGAYATAYDGSAIEDAFRQKRFLDVRHAGATVARFPLQTSSAGFRLLEQCADQWRSRHGRLGASRVARSAPPPPPPPPQQQQVEPPARSAASPPPRQSSPVSVASTQPVPRDQSRWIPADAYARIRTSSWEGGVLEFTLFVTPEGRVSRCVIDEPSGSSEYDDVTCRQLARRARFDPARDAEGKAIEGRYSSKVEFRIPD